MTPKVVWITGASSGIGRALALRLARNGVAVAASARRADELEALARQAHLLEPFPLDIRDREACAATVAAIEERLGPIGQAVLCAGTHDPMLAAAFSAERFAALIEINLVGTANTLAPVMQAMIGRRRGRIAVVSSVAGYVGLPTAAAYGASKAGLISMAEALRDDLRRHGVLMQLISPGFVDTPLTARNPFEMPFLMPVEKAVDALLQGLETDRFEIVFPRRMAWLLKLLRVLPYPVALAATRRLIPREP